MTKETFLAICVIALIPITAFILNWALYLFGYFFWWKLILKYLPKLKPQIIEISRNGDEDFLYYETSIIILFIFCAILAMFL